MRYPLQASKKFRDLMSTSREDTPTPSRRKSDLTLPGTSSQDLGDTVYTLVFGVNLAKTSFEGLNNYSVAITRTDSIAVSHTLTSALEFRLQEDNNTIRIEGGPPDKFGITDETLDLDCMALDEGIVLAVMKGIAWLKGVIQDDWISTNRRKVPVALLDDGIAINQLMSSISTIIGDSLACHNQVIHNRNTLFTRETDYRNAIYAALKEKLDVFTVVAIHRGDAHYVETR